MAATAHIGFWFNTQDLRRAYGSGSRAEEVYLNLTNPLEFGSLGELASYVSLCGSGENAAELGESAADALRASGYDGIILRDEEFGGTSYVALEPNQIKRVDNRNPTENADIRYSISPTFGEELREWDGKSKRTFRVGTTSEALQSIGVKDRGIIWHGGKIAEILRKHSGMSLDIIEQVPTVLENPIIVLKSKQSESRIVTFGELTDKNGAPVTAVVELLPTTKGGELLDMNVIASAYGKDSSPGRLIQNSDVLYLDENKNRTQKWLQSVGLRLPADTTKLGSVGSIAYRDGGVKIQGVPFDQLVDGEKSSTGVLEPEFTNPAWREAVEAGKEQRRKNSISVTEKARQEKAEREQTSATETEERHPTRESVPAKAKGQMERAERALVNQVGKALGFPNFGQREYLKPIAQEISEEYLKTGRVSRETAERLFNKAYSEGIVVEDEFYRQYKPVKDHLRTQAITISEQDKADIADWKEFRKSTFGTLRIVNKGGVPVDVAYQELMEMAPELFPDSVTAPSDQLRKMFDVARSIQKTEVSLEQYYGEDAANFAKWAKNDFEAHLGDAVSELRLVKRYAEERSRKAAVSAEVPTTNGVFISEYVKIRLGRRRVLAEKIRTFVCLYKSAWMLLCAFAAAPRMGSVD